MDELLAIYQASRKTQKESDILLIAGSDEHIPLNDDEDLEF